MESSKKCVRNKTWNHKLKLGGYFLLLLSVERRSRTCSLYISIICTPTSYLIKSCRCCEIRNRSCNARKFTPQSIGDRLFGPICRHCNILKWVYNINSESIKNLKRKGRYHCVCLSRSSLPICKNAHIVSIKYRSYQRLSIKKHLIWKQKIIYGINAWLPKMPEQQ